MPVHKSLWQLYPKWLKPENYPMDFNEWIDKLWNIYGMQYFLAVKNNEIGTWNIMVELQALHWVKESSCPKVRIIELHLEQSSKR
jgi:hypothetical protein